MKRLLFQTLFRKLNKENNNILTYISAYGLRKSHVSFINITKKIAVAALAAIIVFSAMPDAAFAASGKSGKTAKIMLTGDLMCKGQQQKAAYDGTEYDFTPSFKYVKPIFEEADLVVGNLETLVSDSLPLNKDRNYLQGKIYLNAPDAFLKALKNAGFDVLVTANNHCCDGGMTGITETLEKLDEYGFYHTGTFNSEDETRYLIMDVNGIKVGILSYAVYFNNKEELLGDSADYMLNRATTEKIEKDVKALKKDGAEYIIAYNHSGDEYVQTPSDREKYYAYAFANAGVDYVINSHPHVLQKFDKIDMVSKDVRVMYSMGNFISCLSKRLTYETLILELNLYRTSSGKVKLKSQKYYPCYVLKEYDGNSYVIMPESTKYNDGFYDKASSELVKKVKSYFKHIRKIVGTLS